MLIEYQINNKKITKVDPSSNLEWIFPIKSYQLRINIVKIVFNSSELLMSE